MQSNVMTQNREMIALNEGLFGTGRFQYSPISLGLAGTEKTYDVGSLNEKSHSEINYNLAEEYPADQIAAALKPTQTELAQVTAVGNKFTFCQYAKGVEFKVSNMGDRSMVNVRAQIMRELWKEWDAGVWSGTSGNAGYVGNPKGNYTTGAAALSFDSLVTEVTAAIGRIKAVSEMTSDEYSRVTLVHDDSVTAILRKFEGTSEISNEAKFMQLFPGLVLVEAPNNIMPTGGKGEVILVLRESVRLHRASVPAIYNEEPGKHGLSTETLFTYESAGVELEVAGTIQGVKFP